jgi:hypothetical protein
MPMRGKGFRQAQTGKIGLSVSGFEDGQIGIAPTVNGNRHPQQISVIGLTKPP